MYECICHGLALYACCIIFVFLYPVKPCCNLFTADFKCYTCDGPLPEFCLDMMKPITCPEPYCINELTNSVNGEKLIDRRFVLYIKLII